MKEINETRGLRVSASVRVSETQDGAVLLDIQQGICISMTPVAIKIWRQLKLGQSSEQITAMLAREFHDVPQAQIQNDMDEFLGSLVRNGLLVQRNDSGSFERVPRLLKWLRRRPPNNGDRRPPSAMTPAFLVWKAVLGFLAFDVFRFGTNFTRLHRYVQNWPTTFHQSTDDDSVERVRRAINYASVLYPKRVLCLQRSAVTTCLLRSCGVSAQMVIGAQKSPFRAHAWTEVNGRPVNERRDVQKAYLVWERC